MSQPSLVLVIATLVGLLALVLGVVLFRGRQAVVRRIEGLFRRPRKPAKHPDAAHYYKPYWS
jgi:hypothetical protein